jgi:hypothetical protein
MLLNKCNFICDKIYLDFFGSIPNVIFVAYVIVKGPHDELSICCMIFHIYNKNCLIFANYFSNCMRSLGNFLINGLFESYPIVGESKILLIILIIYASN